MTEKELRKLNRKQLLELLLKQTKRVDELEKELEECKAELDNKKLVISECGSLAEACLKLNGIFEAAQNAADQYLENVENSNPKKALGSEETKKPTRNKKSRRNQKSKR